MRNKNKSYNTFPPPLPSSQAQLYSRILYLLSPSSIGGWGMGAVVSSSHVVCAAPSSSGVGLLTLCACSSVGSHQWETVLHELLQCESFPWVAVLHKLLQCGSLPQGTVCQEQTTPAWVPQKVHRSCQEPAPAWAPHRVTASFRCIHLLQCGVLHGLLQVDICSTVDLHGLQGHSLPHHGLLHRLQRNLCSGTSPSFFNDLVVCRVVYLTYSHSCL